MVIYTYNCRTLRSNERIEELLEEVRKTNCEVIGLCEVRRNEEELIKISSQDIEIYLNGHGDKGGTGFLVKNRTRKNIIKFKEYSHRISKMIIRLQKYQGGGRLKIIQVYAPTSEAEEEDVEEFYDNLQTALEEDLCKYVIVMGDWNSKVGQGKTGRAVGEFGLGKRNERGKRLIEFAESNSLFIMNTFFQKDDSKKITWISPDGRTKNQIDYILSNRKEIVLDIESDHSLNLASDHIAVKAKLKLKINKKLWITKTKKTDIDYNQSEFEKLLEHQLNEINEDRNITELNDDLVKSLKYTRKSSNQTEPNDRKKKLPKEIRKLFKKRRKLKREGKEKIEFTVISKLIRVKIKEWSMSKKIEELKMTLEKGASIKKIFNEQKIGKREIISIKNEKGGVVNDKKEIMQTIRNYYSKLYGENNDGKDKNEKNEVKNITSFKENWENIIILRSEIERVIKKLKNGKAGGEDSVINEELKAGGQRLIEFLKVLFNKCLADEQVPDSWLESKLMLLFKKGDKLNLDNYRPICLLSVIYKVFMGVIANRVSKALEETLDVSQVGFRSNFSTIDNIFVVKQLIKASNQYGFPLAIAFVDFQKAFDSLITEEIITTLEEAGINGKYIKIIKYIYDNATLNIEFRGEKSKVKIKKGTRQGDVLSAKIFTAVLERACKHLGWLDYGFNIDGKKLNILKFADDIVLFGKSKEEITNMLEELIENSKKVGLIINSKKTKIMTINMKPEEIVVSEGTIERVEEYLYLGQLINMKGDEESEIRRRIALSWNSFNKFKHFFKSEVSMELKNKLWKKCVLPILIYGVETWSLPKSIISKMRVTQRRMERSMLGITRRNRKTNTWVREETGLTDIGRVMLERKWNWAGHLARVKDGRWTRQLIQWYPRERKRKRGRPVTRWDEEMRRSCGGETWPRVAQERTEWQRMKNVYLDVWLYKS